VSCGAGFLTEMGMGMRNLCYELLRADDSTDQTSSKIDANQLVSISVMAIFSDTDAAGSVKLQFSNDPCNAGNVAASAFTPTNWLDVASASVAVVAGAKVALVLPQITYRWLRVVWTQTTPGTGEITVNVNALGI
jgi:hypothetical protein